MAFERDIATRNNPFERTIFPRGRVIGGPDGPRPFGLPRNQTGGRSATFGDFNRAPKQQSRRQRGLQADEPLALFDPNLSNIDQALFRKNRSPSVAKLQEAAFATRSGEGTLAGPAGPSTRERQLARILFPELQSPVLDPFDEGAGFDFGDFFKNFVPQPAPAAPNIDLNALLTQFTTPGLPVFQAQQRNTLGSGFAQPTSAPGTLNQEGLLQAILDLILGGSF
jgi:hypothetical protein